MIDFVISRFDRIETQMGTRALKGGAEQGCSLLHKENWLRNITVGDGNTAKFQEKKCFWRGTFGISFLEIGAVHFFIPEIFLK